MRGDVAGALDVPRGRGATARSSPAGVAAGVVRREDVSPQRCWTSTRMRAMSATSAASETCRTVTCATSHVDRRTRAGPLEAGRDDDLERDRAPARTSVSRSPDRARRWSRCTSLGDVPPPCDGMRRDCGRRASRERRQTARRDAARQWSSALLSVGHAWDRRGQAVHRALRHRRRSS